MLRRRGPTLCGDMARILITGATGFIGSHVARLLVERGDEVTVTVRAASRTDALGDLPVKKVKADVRDRRAVRRAMQGIERVFHLAGTANFAIGREEMFALNLEGTRIVLEEALRAGVERAVYTSSVAAIGPSRDGRPADEHKVWEAGRYGIPYVDSKHEAEVVAMRLAARGLPLVIVNPAWVFGAGDLGESSTSLVRRFLRREIPVYVDGTLNIVGVRDVAHGHLLADERGEVGERYILGNRNFTFDRLFADLGRLSGVEPPSLKLPATVALALASAAARLPGLSLPMPVEVRAASLHWAVLNTKARRELGWRPSPHEEALEETIDWYRHHDSRSLAPAGARQPLALRLAAGAARRTGLV
jgi:dihydroflavonol-4-reductase